MELFLYEWDEHGIIRDLYNYKLLFIESRDVNESNLAVYNYKKACDEGKVVFCFVLLEVIYLKVSTLMTIMVVVVL